jgi:hypothetical protein
MTKLMQQETLEKGVSGITISIVLINLELINQSYQDHVVLSQSNLPNFQIDGLQYVYIQTF